MVPVASVDPVVPVIPPVVVPITREEALRAFAESVGMPVDAMWEGVTRNAGGAIVGIHWGFKDLDGILPEGDLNMPMLTLLNLKGNKNLRGSCVCERNREMRENMISVHLSVSMQTVDFRLCGGLTGINKTESWGWWRSDGP